MVKVSCNPLAEYLLLRRATSASAFTFPHIVLSKVVGVAVAYNANVLGGCTSAMISLMSMHKSRKKFLRGWGHVSGVLALGLTCNVGHHFYNNNHLFGPFVFIKIDKRISNTLRLTVVSTLPSHTYAQRSIIFLSLKYHF